MLHTLVERMLETVNALRVRNCVYFIVIALLSAGIWGNAFSVEVGCAGPNRNPAACSLEECLARGAAKDAACSGYSCQGVTGCAALQAKLAKGEACLAAREFVSLCYFVPHDGHVAAMAQVRNAIARCTRKIALPEPIGCADPCP